MINEILPHRFDNEMIIGATANQSDYIVIFIQDKVLMKTENHSFVLPTYQELQLETTIDTNRMEYLFAIDDKRYFACRGLSESQFAGNQKLSLESFQIYRTLQPEYIAFALITAKQLCRWMDHHSFCAHCGSRMEKSTKERALVCEVCGDTVYPTIAPAVTVAITNQDKLLLARNAHGVFRKFALVAGFVEVGESFEDTVRREVMEEVGLKVKNVRYYKSQPWGSSDNVMVGFFVDLDGDDKITIQEEELAEARWFTRDELDKDLSQISLSFEMIEMFRTGNYPK